MIKLNNNINKIIIDTIRPNQLENLHELKPIFDNRKSFYKKAYVGTYTFKNNEKVIYLKSYNTIVASIWVNQLYKTELRIYGGFSQTTARHIREFAKQNGFTDWISFAEMKNGVVYSL